MRIWDIVDKVYPGVEITEPIKHRIRPRGAIWSAMHIALAVGMVVSTASSFSVDRQVRLSNEGVVLKISTAPADGKDASSERGQARPARSTDTQFGRSTSRLSSAFSAFFQPAPDDEGAGVDYSF
jgi:hypothetical protein